MLKELTNFQEIDKVISGRSCPDTIPRHIILARELDDENEPALVIHTAGCEKLDRISIRKAALDDELLDGMNDKDRNLIKWIFENDKDIDNYNYKD